MTTSSPLINKQLGGLKKKKKKKCELLSGMYFWPHAINVYNDADCFYCMFSLIEGVLLSGKSLKF